MRRTNALIGIILGVVIASSGVATADYVGDLGIVEYFIDGSGATPANSTITLTSGGTIASSSNGDIVINANGTGTLDVRDMTEFGDGTYSWDACDGQGDVCIEGELEVDALALFDGGIQVAEYTKYIDIEPGYATLGPTGPTPVTIATAYRCLAFDNDNESVFFSTEMPDDYVDNTDDDVTLRIYWVPEDSDALTDGESTKFDISYRTASFDSNDSLDSGSATTATVTYTQSGAGSNLESRISVITLDADDADNPIDAGEVLSIQFDRDMTGDTYTGDAQVCQWEISYTSNEISNHH